MAIKSLARGSGGIRMAPAPLGGMLPSNPMGVTPNYAARRPPQRSISAFDSTGALMPGYEVPGATFQPSTQGLPVGGIPFEGYPSGPTSKFARGGRPRLPGSVPPLPFQPSAAPDAPLGNPMADLAGGVGFIDPAKVIY